MKHDKETYTFNLSDIDEIVEARLEEIFDAINKELKKAGRAGQLPSGVVLIGGGARLKHLAEFVKAHLGLAARIGKTTGYGGVVENIEEPQYATAVGLMLLDAQGGMNTQTVHHKGGPGLSGKAAMQQASGFVSKFLDRFKA